MSSDRKDAIPKDTLERLILTRQLELISPPTLTTVFGLPIWALLVSWTASGAYPSMGVATFETCALWFCALLIVCILAYALDFAYRRARKETLTFDPGPWSRMYTAVLSLLSISWSSLIWVFWIPGNDKNHLVLTVFVICGIMNGIITRMQKFDCYIYGSGAAFALLWVRCLALDSEASVLVVVMVPPLFVALTTGVRTASRQIYENIAAQIENEFLRDENARARDEAERASRMKSAFLANMSHELRTPLNAILGFSEIISSHAFGPDADGKYRDYAADIHESGRHLLNMINGLLDVAKIEAGKLELDVEWIGAGDVIQQAAKLVAEKAEEKGLALRLDFEPQAERLLVDERSFRQIAINLLSNAVKFTEHGYIEAALKVVDGRTVFSVTDTGCGIPEAQIARVFDAFEQVDNRYTKANAGTGLGLTLVRALAKLHGGDCKIESADGKGTKVSVFFPQPHHPNVVRSGAVQARVA
ncbi:MAG: HAMP domain-containing sensor histidine kinase [Micropepsaceae bacterium]